MKKALKIGCLVFFVIPVFIGIVISIINDEDQIEEKLETSTVTEATQISKEKKTVEIIEKQTLNFQALNVKKVGLNTQNRATQKIIANSDSLPNEDILRETALKHWKRNSFSSYDEFTVFIYLDGMDTNSTAYSIVEFNKGGNITFFKVNDYSLIGTKWDN